MPNPARCYHEKLLLYTTIHALHYSSKAPTYDLRKCLPRGFTSSITRRDGHEPELQIASRRRARVSKYLAGSPLDSLVRRYDSAGSRLLDSYVTIKELQRPVRWRGLVVRCFSGGLQWRGSVVGCFSGNPQLSGSLARRYHSDRQSLDSHTATKESQTVIGQRSPTNSVIRKIIPVDPAEEMSNMARYNSKRHDEATNERFLGIKRVTKHDIVDNALRQVQAIPWENKDLQKSSITKRSDHYEEDVEGLQADEAAVVQPFGPSDVTGPEPQAAAVHDSVDSSLGGNEDSRHDQVHGKEENTKFGSKKLVNIDWDNLPLSPLMHQRLINARKKFRGIKPLPKDAPGYDEQKGLEMSNNYLATMLASPVRACRLTHVRLPNDFLLTTQVIQHPETGQAWELPQGLDRQDATVGLPSDTPISPDMSDPQLTSETEVQPISLSESKQNPSLGGYNGSSYMISTQTIVKMVSDLAPARYAKIIPVHWLSKLGRKLANKVHWRKDMPDFVHSLIQRQISDELRVLHPSHGGEIIQACVTLDESEKQVIKQLPNLKERTILYFGKQERSATQDISFYSIINAIADGQTVKVTVLDNLFGTPQSVGAYSHLVRIQKEDGENILVFDMTRLLAPKFAKSLLDAGYDQPAYLTGNTPESRFLHTRLWWLAHYIEQKGTA